MKILLIQSALAQNDFLIYPAGLAAIAGVLKNHEIRSLDLNVVDDPGKALAGIKQEFQPDVVGISFRNIDDQNRRQVQYYYRTNFQPDIRMIRSIFGSEVRLIAGGSAFSLFARHIMIENPEIDFGVFLEGEETFPFLLDHLTKPEKVKGVFYRRKGEIIFTGSRPLPDFDALPMPRWDLFSFSDYSDPTGNGIGIQTVRGCTNLCTYCDYPDLNGNRFRYKYPSKVVDEMLYLGSRFGIKKLFFTDACFGLARKHSLALLDEMIERKVDMKWWANFDLNAEFSFLLKAHEAGCRGFIFSPDGYSDKTIKHLKKNFTFRHLKRHIRWIQTNETIKDSFKLYTFMLSVPGETNATYLKTLFSLFFIKIKSMLKLTYPVSVSIAWIRIEPNTGIFKKALLQNKVAHETDLLPEISSSYEPLFYINPATRKLDSFIFRVIKGLIRLKKSITPLFFTLDR